MFKYFKINSNLLIHVNTYVRIKMSYSYAVNRLTVFDFIINVLLMRCIFKMPERTIMLRKPNEI